ncbi:transposase [Chryseobacterium sp. SL1]|uniref:transposase n=1 Tax=Chryseobacterium sp. SL1 TaxID=2995159 RepID=UPI002272C875|nr:transposase [Chryseobacterium sp. SL1]MCY1660184.1 transposase [Chryseobacterium sp. SL1]
MQTDFKEINIGMYIRQCVKDRGIDISRIYNFFKCSEDEINKMYYQKSMDTHILLLWSKLLNYDFFRLYTQHLILYSPPTKLRDADCKDKSTVPQFRKNIYTKEIIDFILEMLKTRMKTKSQIISEYGIPKTTLHKWISKYDL